MLFWLVKIRISGFERRVCMEEAACVFLSARLEKQHFPLHHVGIKKTHPENVWRSYDLIYRTLVSFLMGDIFMISNVSDMFHWCCQRRSQRSGDWVRVLGPCKKPCSSLCSTYLLEAHWTFVSTVKLFLTLRRLARTYMTDNKHAIRLCNLNLHDLELKKKKETDELSISIQHF